MSTYIPLGVGTGVVATLVVVEVVAATKRAKDNTQCNCEQNQYQIPVNNDQKTIHGHQKRY